MVVGEIYMDTVAFNEKTQCIIGCISGGREGETLLAFEAVRKKHVLHGVYLRELWKGTEMKLEIVKCKTSQQQDNDTIQWRKIALYHTEA